MKYLELENGFAIITTSTTKHGDKKMEKLTISHVWFASEDNEELDFEASMKVDGKYEHIQKVSKLPNEKFLVTLERFGDTYHNGKNIVSLVNTFQVVVDQDQEVEACLV